MMRKLWHHANRLVRARRFDVPFARRAGFRVPATIRVGERVVPLRFPDDDGIAADFLTCLIDDVYGLSRLPAPPGAILDIGANVGFFSMAARAYFPLATIHAYEPNPRVLGCLRHHAGEAGFTYFPEAVGAEEGRVGIEELGDSNQARTSSREGGGVTRVALERALQRLGGTADLAKIDCEGAEWDLFRAEKCWSRIREVRMEYHLWKTREVGEVLRILDRLNFAVNKHESSGDFGLIWCSNRGNPPPRCFSPAY